MSFVSWEEDMRDADIVNLAVVSTRCGVNHAYFASIWCYASYIIFVAYYSVKQVLPFSVSAPFA